MGTVLGHGFGEQVWPGKNCEPVGHWDCGMTWHPAAAVQQAGLAERSIYAAYVHEAFLTKLEAHADELVFQFSFGAEPPPCRGAKSSPARCRRSIFLTNVTPTLNTRATSPIVISPCSTAATTRVRSSFGYGTMPLILPEVA